MNKLLLHNLLILILILTITSSHASNLQLPATGQAISQSDGDDGAVQAGKPWPDPRFSDNHNGTVRDNLTGLVWSGDANPLINRSTRSDSKGEVVWQKALDAIKRLNAEAYLGYGDWRLPNLNELASLVHQGEPAQNTWFNFNGFTNSVAAGYWSSSSFTRDAARAWTVQMDGGSVDTLQKNGSALVWPVRGGSSMLPSTGQVACFDSTGLKIECSGTGQDGELRMGFPWTALRFSGNGNGTISDNLTGLIWPQNANPAMDAQIARSSDGSVLWPDALGFITSINSTEYLGFSDWRLPNRNELLSLVNYAETTPGVHLNKAGASDIQEKYWSSGTSAASSSNAWNVNMSGKVVEQNKYDLRFGSYVWPVRGGIETLPVSVQADVMQTKTLAKTVAATAVTLSVTTTTLPTGTIGATYSQTLAATGGTTPYTWTRKSGTLPAGLTISTAGVISGTPTTAGAKTFTVQVKDKAAKTATKSLSITVTATPATPPSITTTALSDGVVSITYSQALTATGGKTPYTWSKTAGSLPAGLALSTTGVISGLPTIAGASSFTVQVKDANNISTTKALAITVVPPLGIVTTGLPDGSGGSTYNQSFVASGGKAPYTWSITSGSLPTGLTLTASTGTVSGAPATSGWSNFTVQVKDANNNVATTAFSLYINQPLSIVTTSLPGGYVGIPYNQTLTCSGGTPPCNWSIIGGSLPAELTLNPTSGVISGTPTLSGTGSFTVQARDAGNVTASVPLSIVITTFGSISGVVTDQATGVPLSGINVTLKLDYINNNPIDKLYSCNNVSLTSAEYATLATNDGAKFSCPGASSTSTMQFRVRNPFGVTDPFTAIWNGIGTLNTYPDKTEYLAQSFKPTRSGTLNKVSFYVPYSLSTYLEGGANVVLKSRLGGDRGTYLAMSNSVALGGIGGVRSKVPTWVDFTFPAPVQVTAGQEYFLEINGTFFEWYGSAAYLYRMNWSDGISYAEGNAYSRSLGLWSPTPLSFAFRTFLDSLPDVNVEPSVNSIAMYGGNTVQVGTSVYSPATATWNGYLPINLNYPDSDGYYDFNGDDLTASGAFTGNAASFYDSAGWITVKASSKDATWFTNLTTDYFDIIFNLSFTVTTDATGAYSFADLPDGNYTLTFDKLAYTPTTSTGILTPGQVLHLDTPVAKALPASLQGLVQLSGGTTWYGAGVTVTLTDPVGTHTTVSDADGNYRIDGIAYGAYSVTFSGPYLQTATNTGTLTAGQTATLNVWLNVFLPAVTVTAPLGEANVTTTPIMVTGNAANTETITVTVQNNGVITIFQSEVSNGTFSIPVEILLGQNNFSITARNPRSMRYVASRNVNAMYLVRNLGDSGNVAVMEVTGNHDAKNPDGTYNDLPRKAIATEYFKSHGDVDFLIYLSTFNYAMPEATAQGFYLPVKNDVQGINQPIIDNTTAFGSAGKLQGTIDLGNVTQLAANPYGPKLEETVTTLNHELMHRFGSYVRFKNPDGTLNTSLLGKDSAHWSYLLDSKGSIMYGNGWQDNGNGTFTSTSARNSFSSLDLYLMGMIPKEQVPPMLLIDNASIDKTQLPQLGATISGTAKTVSIDDIIAAEGERIPNAATSQKKFNVGFVLLTRAGDNATAATQAMETLRSAWAGRLAEQTNGIGGVNGVAPSVSVSIDSPAEAATITGPDVTVGGTVINTSGAETGLTINGMPATVTGNRFIVNHVPLQSGANSLVVSATDANGLTASAARNVTAAPGNYIRISSNIESGTGPLEVSLRIDGSFSVTAPTVNVTGPGGAATLTAVSATEYTANFVSEGTYTITVTSTGPDGQTYTDSVMVTVMSRYQLEALLKGKWEGMKAKVTSGDIQGAGTYFPQASREMFLTMFGDTTIDSVSRLNDVSAVNIYTLSDYYAQGGLIRQDEDGEFSYPITFSRDESGLWRIYNF